MLVKVIFLLILLVGLFCKYVGALHMIPMFVTVLPHLVTNIEYLLYFVYCAGTETWCPVRSPARLWAESAR